MMSPIAAYLCEQRAHHLLISFQGLHECTNTAPRANWTAIAVSKDGIRGIAAVSCGGIFTLDSPALILTNSNNSISLLWSTNYTPVELGLA